MTQEGSRTSESLARAAAAAVRETLDVPRSPSAVLEACTALTSRVTQLLGAVYERLSDEEPIACRQGCSFCCHLRVMVFPHEAIALAAHVQGLPEEEAEPLKQRLVTAAAQRVALDPSEPFPAMACPFLVEGRCRVYALRPVACAGYHSLQRGACEQRYETRGGRVGIPVARELRDALVTVCEQVEHTVAERGLAAGRVELATAVAALLERPELVDEWVAGGEWPCDARGLVSRA